MHNIKRHIAITNTKLPCVTKEWFFILIPRKFAFLDGNMSFISKF